MARDQQRSSTENLEAMFDCGQVVSDSLPSTFYACLLFLTFNRNVELMFKSIECIQLLLQVHPITTQDKQTLCFVATAVIRLLEINKKKHSNGDRTKQCRLWITGQCCQLKEQFELHYIPMHIDWEHIQL